MGSVGFIKIDAEGHELEVLKGASGVICRDLPVLLVEIEERHRPGVKPLIARLVRELGYRCYVLREGRLHEHDLAATGERHRCSIRNHILIPEKKVATYRGSPFFAGACSRGTL